MSPTRLMFGRWEWYSTASSLEVAAVVNVESPFFDENVNVLMHNIINPHIKFDF